MVDSTLNAIYLLGTTESERKAYASAPISEDTLHSGTAEELVHQAKTLNQLDQVPAHRLKSMNERIDSICSSGRTNPDTWRVIVASIFPQSNHLLAGSIDAYVFPFSKHPGGGTIGHGDEFTLLFLMGSNVIFELICALATHSDIGPLRSEAEKVHEEIMATMKSRNTGIEDPAQGARDQLDRIEHFGSRKLLSQLVEFKTAFIFSYEAALIAPTLRKENDRGKFKLAALYFRRSLNDLRSVWLLLQRGYTAQAAACAGSLFETCLAAICLLDIKNVQAFQAKLQTATGNDFPWGPMEMAKMSCASGYDLLISP
jgi:hypothetical protein